MANEHRFLISFIVDNQPKTLEAFWFSDTLPRSDAENLLHKSYPGATITDIQITSIHHDTNPDVHPGYYQQPEGN